jgi:hypothetical protein
MHSHFGRGGSLLAGGVIVACAGALALLLSTRASSTSAPASSNKPAHSHILGHQRHPVRYRPARVRAGSRLAPTSKTITSSAAIPGAMVRFAADSHVTGLDRLGPATSTGLGWFSGTNAAGQTVVAVGSPREFGPFVPLDYALRADLDVFSEDGGSTLTSVDWRELAGLVGPNVERVEVVLQGGGTRTTPLAEHAFVYSGASPDPLPVKVVAYDDTGAVVATKDLPSLAAPGAGCAADHPLCHEVGDPGKPLTGKTTRLTGTAGR